MRYNLLSPDGFAIHPTKTYPSVNKLADAFSKWKMRYEAQGYYSSNFKRIPLEKLLDNCTIVEV